MLWGLGALAGGAMSMFVPGVPVGTVVAMVLAAAAAIVAGRLHAASRTLALGGAAAATPTLRAARFCDDATLALCVLATLFALSAA